MINPMEGQFRLMDEYDGELQGSTGGTTGLLDTDMCVALAEPKVIVQLSKRSWTSGYPKTEIR